MNDELTCKYCSKLCKNRNSLVQHEIRCKNNDNRKIVNHKGINNPMYGKKAWNYGLTKDSDIRIKKSSETLHKTINRIHDEGKNILLVYVILKKKKNIENKKYLIQ